MWYTLKRDKKVDSFIDKTVLSDHYLVVTTCYLGYKDFYDTQRRDLVFAYIEPNMIRSKLLVFINNCANHLCPFRNMDVRQNKPSWITNELIEMIKERDQAFEDAFPYNRPTDLIYAKKLEHLLRELSVMLEHHIFRIP